MEIVINRDNLDKLIFENYEWSLVKDNKLIVLDNSLYMQFDSMLKELIYNNYEFTDKDLNLLNIAITSFVIKYICNYNNEIGQTYISMGLQMQEYFNSITTIILRDYYDINYLDYTAKREIYPVVKETSHMPPTAKEFMKRNSILWYYADKDTFNIIEKVSLDLRNELKFYFNVINIDEDKHTHTQRFYMIDLFDYVYYKIPMLVALKDKSILPFIAINWADCFNNVYKEQFHFTQEHITYDGLMKICTKYTNK